jgi:hypothetical protein
MQSAAQPTQEQDLFCARCGYNQRGIASDRCPECGILYSDQPPIASRIPWLHRRHMGWWRCYWRTVRLVVSRRDQLTGEMANPVSYSDARPFWLINAIVVYAAFLLAFVALYAIIPAGERKDSVVFTLWWVPIWPAVSMQPAILLFIALATRLPSFFCQSRRLPVAQRNRAIALSYYAGAPLSGMILVLAVIMLGGALIGKTVGLAIMLMVLGALLAIVVFAVWYVGTVILIRSAAGKRAGWWAAGLLPPLWLLTALLCAAIAVTLHFMILMVYSMLDFT